MSEQNASTPAAPATSRPGGINDFYSKAEAAINDLGKEPETAEAETAPEESEADAPGVEAEATEEDDSEPSLGDASNPYTVKTLPDAHVVIKVDGEEHTVPLREMVDGYMRESAFHKRVNEVTELKRQAETVVTKAQEERSKLQSSLRDLINTPEDLYEFLDDHAEATLDKVARMRLQKIAEWSKNPQAKYEADRQRHEAKLRKEAEKLAREREEWTRSRTETEATEKMRKALEPGWQAGLKEAGYPTITDDFRVMVRGILNAKRDQTGKPWTADDMKDAIVRAARITKAESVKDRKPLPAKAPVPGQKRPTQPAAAKPVRPGYRDFWKNIGK